MTDDEMEEGWIYLPPEELKKYQDELNKLYRELMESLWLK